VKRFKNILFVHQLAVEDTSAFERAAALAEENTARLKVIEILEEVSPDIGMPVPVLLTDVLRNTLIEESREQMEELVAPLRRQIDIDVDVLTGTPFLEIIREVLRNRHDLVIKAADKGGLITRVFGSTDMHLLRKCPTPVWLHKHGHVKPYHRILAAVDFDEFSGTERESTLNRDIMDLAASLAQREHSELYVAHAWYPHGAELLQTRPSGLTEEEINEYINETLACNERRLSQLMGSAETWVGTDVWQEVRPKTRLVKGLARRAIPELAEELQAELIVMGTIGHAGIAGILIGSTAETILSRIDCSVLAIKPEGFVTPVTIEN
jgi:nucleotide-binding universal stress UspA family protein